jgi:hypothetical protein
MTDSSTSTYWYPAANQFRNSYWEVVLETPCFFQKADMIFSNGGYRPTQIRVDVSNDGVGYQSVGIYDIPQNNSTTPSVDTITFPSAGFFTHIKFTCLDIVNPLFIGYGVYNFKLYGVKNQ